mmetsp:Transcript_41578/g.120503  ORF Transcript_41578/g.120503 Transcript_41578/m.120503 type:complete len:188 (+) Transcript_41578:108-671(+)
MLAMASSSTPTVLPAVIREMEDAASSSDADQAAVEAQSPRSRRGPILMAVAVSALLALAAMLATPALQAFQPAPVEDMRAIVMKAPDEMYEFYAPGTPIDGSSKWMTCWHNGMSKCSSDSKKCCCKAGWVFGRPLPRSIVQAFSDGTADDVSKQLYDHMKKGTLRQFYGECIKEEQIPPDALKAIKA